MYIRINEILEMAIEESPNDPLLYDIGAALYAEKYFFDTPTVNSINKFAKVHNFAIKKKTDIFKPLPCGTPFILKYLREEPCK